MSLCGDTWVCGVHACKAPLTRESLECVPFALKPCMCIACWGCISVLQDCAKEHGDGTFGCPVCKQVVVTDATEVVATEATPGPADVSAEQCVGHPQCTITHCCMKCAVVLCPLCDLRSHFCKCEEAVFPIAGEAPTVIFAALKEIAAQLSKLPESAMAVIRQLREGQESECAETTAGKFKESFAEFRSKISTALDKCEHDALLAISHDSSENLKILQTTLDAMEAKYGHYLAYEKWICQLVEGWPTDGIASAASVAMKALTHARMVVHAGNQCFASLDLPLGIEFYINEELVGTFLSSCLFATSTKTASKPTAREKVRQDRRLATACPLSNTNLHLQVESATSSWAWNLFVNLPTRSGEGPPERADDAVFAHLASSVSVIIFNKNCGGRYKFQKLVCLWQDSA